MVRVMEQVADWVDIATPKIGREFFQFLVLLYWVGVIFGFTFLLIANYS